ncbi:MAG: hypothetical protein A2X25_02940 [Chloroflexi bacterium GWB2_49_20]|nr:MAG: hypothetical protein A2X25_02940 [Chloroflexi bacterium GWB2_49_20]OGN78744.1 MAG: hypothetical protein A2X26_12840 [Chloroflexi bacterium GWC2_49_37]OGN85886.1 MAG: hypothetical protein A2X27_11845 [Chloroflexi bacterium GWD2_49_16]
MKASEIVTCHSDYEYAERPVALTWKNQRLEITEIIERWRIPGARCFRVRTADGQIFELFYGELYDEWRIHQP